MAIHEDLTKWLDDAPITRAEFARRCEYDPSNLNKLLKGTIKPSLEMAFKIERETGGAISASGWVQAA